MTNQSLYARVQSSMWVKKAKLYALFLSSLLVWTAPLGLGYLKMSLIPLICMGVIAIALLILAFTTKNPARSFYYWAVAGTGAILAMAFTSFGIAGDWLGAWFISAISGISARISLHSLEWLRPDYGQEQTK